MRNLKHFILTMLLALTSLTASAYDFKFGGIYYNILTDETSVQVTYEDGSTYNTYSGKVVIPSSVTNSETGITYSVTEIGTRAFSNCDGLTSVTMPNSVTTIDKYAFYGSSALASVTIGDSVTTIGNFAFSGTALYYDKSKWEDNVLYIGKYLIKADNVITGDYKIKDGTLTIANDAFYGCSYLTSVTVPNSVTKIGEYTFANCTGLTSVTMPNSVNSFGPFAFYGCTGLTSVTIPNSVTEIGGSAFLDCTELISVTIGNSVTEIGGSAFCRCYALTSVTIPNSVTEIGNSAFYQCNNLNSVTIGNSVTSIKYGAFCNCPSLTSLTIGSSVTEIGDNAFYGCTDLAEIISLNTTAPTVEKYTFQDVNKEKCKVIVPTSAVSNYSGWGSFSTITDRHTVSSFNENMATLWLSYPVTVPTGIEAYSAKLSAERDKVMLTKIDSTFIPAKTGVVLKNIGGGSNYDFILAPESFDATAETDLLGYAADVTLTDSESDYYYELTYNDSGANFGFYRIGETETLKANKAYLKLPTGGSSSAPIGISIEWGDEDPTELESTVERYTDNGTKYNLQGMPIGNNYKGIVIKDGRKMLNK